AAIEEAIEVAGDPNSAWLLLFTLSSLRTEAALPVFVDLLSRPVPPELESALDAHDARLAFSSQLIVRTTMGLAGIGLSGSAAAREALLNAATQHPLSLVRGTAIHQIELHGNASLRD